MYKLGELKMVLLSHALFLPNLKTTWLSDHIYSEKSSTADIYESDVAPIVDNGSVESLQNAIYNLHVL